MSLLSAYRLWIVQANHSRFNAPNMNPPDPTLRGDAPPAAAAPPKPTGARHWVLVFAATLAAITYIDRVCMSQAKPYIANDLRLSDAQIAFVFAIFVLANGILAVPSGWLGDKIGPRKVLMQVVILWSFFTAAMGQAWNYASLLVIQCLFGAGESGAFPNLAKTFTNWLPSRERNRAVSVMWLCTRWAGAVTPLLFVWVVSLVGSWRRAFMVFALPGVVWAAIFYWWFLDNPRNHPGVNAAELELLNETRQNAAGHVRVPWSKILRSRTVWLLFVQYFCFGYGWYFYVTWLPTYVHEVRHVELQKGALLSGIPLFFGGFACILSGWLASWLVRRGFALARVRRGLSFVGYWGAAAMLLLSPQIADPVWAMLAMGLASFSLDLTLSVCWRTAMDVGGKYAGSVSGTMNMAGQIGGAVGMLAVPYVINFMKTVYHLNNSVNGVTAAPDPALLLHFWTVVFCISAAIYFIGGLCWLGIDPVTPVSKGEEDPPPAARPA
jgi:MFS family permease